MAARRAMVKAGWIREGLEREGRDMRQRDSRGMALGPKWLQKIKASECISCKDRRCHAIRISKKGRSGKSTSKGDDIRIGGK
jgi:hypothetical protein